MKKLLSILAAVGLTATASTSVVACTTTIKGDKAPVTLGTVTDDGLASKVITASPDNYYVSFTKKVRFNKHTNYDEIKDANGSVIGYRLMPYKLHLVATTAQNLAKDGHPSDLFSWGGNDGKGGTNEKTGEEGTLATTAYVTTSETSWFNTDKKRPTAWPTPDHTYDSGDRDANGNPINPGHINVDGILQNDITVKATFTVVIPKDSVKPGDTIKMSLIRVEPLTDEVEPGQYMNENDANITFTTPTPTTTN